MTESLGPYATFRERVAHLRATAGISLQEARAAIEREDLEREIDRIENLSDVKAVLLKMLK